MLFEYQAIRLAKFQPKYKSSENDLFWHKVWMIKISNSEVKKGTSFITNTSLPETSEPGVYQGVPTPHPAFG